MATETRRRATRKDRRGREQRRKSRTAQSRRPDLSKFYAYRLPQVQPGDFTFRLDVIDGVRRGVPFPLDTFVTGFGWEEEAAEMTGTVNLRWQDPQDGAPIELVRGTLVRCRTRWQGRWFELWTMRIEKPQETPGAGEFVADLADDMALARRGSRRWVWRTTRKRRHGWFPHELLREAAKKEGIKLGKVARGTRRIEKLDIRGSFFDLAVKVYRNERDRTGRKFVLRMRNGRFEVVPFDRNKILYRLARQLREAVVTQDPKVKEPVTVLTGRGTIWVGRGEGRREKRIRYTAFSRSVVEKLGYSAKTKRYGRVESQAKLKAAVKRDLARQYRVVTKASVSTPGIPFIRRGDAALIPLLRRIARDQVGGETLSAEELEEKSYVFVTAVRHAVDSSGYTTDIDADYADPILADKRRRERESRARARKGRDDLAGGDGDGEWNTSGASIFNDAVGYQNDEQIAGRMCFAELGMGAYMGSLPYRTVIELRYNGGPVVRSIKLDIGDGGGPVDGHRRDVDLHEDTAAAVGILGLGLAVVQWRVVS